LPDDVKAVSVSTPNGTRRSSARRFRLPSNIVAGGIGTVVLLALYLSTAAPDLTFWDAAELTTAAHTLGIPHPPGTPLWVLLGHLAGKAFQSVGPARAVTLLSVVASAFAGGLGAMMAARWIGSRGAVAAAVSAGAMMSIWSNATEAEVYAVALLFSVALLAAGERAGRAEVSDDERSRWRALIAFLSALAIPLHLSVLVALPAAVTLAWRGRRPTTRELVAFLAVGALGASAVAILPLLASREPALDSGHPVTIPALLDVLRRAQYDVAGLWPRRAPLWLQLGNVLEWADWQVAFGLHPDPRPSWKRTSLTVAWAWLALLGVRSLWRHEARVGRAMTVLLGSGTIGVALWLNMRLGPSYGAGVVAADAVHEARERDYFFVLGFWAWGLCAGAGMAAMAREFAKRLPRPATLLLSSLPFALAAVPLVANRPVMDRAREPSATLPRTVARLLLEAVPPNGVLYTAGDNDSFPLWYLQQVEQVRPDVLVITVPLLGATWYREELARRHQVLAASSAEVWSGLGPTLRATASAARAARRPIRVSVLLAAVDRRQIEPDSGWALEGLVYAPSAALPAGQVGLAPAVLRRARERVPTSALRALPPDVDPAYGQMQSLLRCTQVDRVADPLLVGTCNGG
jgi:hypothetical protein